MTQMTIQQILEWTTGSLMNPENSQILPLDFVFSRLSTDTRAILPGDVFLALRGNQFDGHDFLNLAAKSGASASIIDQAFLKKGGTLPGPSIVVEDTLTALQQIAKGYRQTLPGIVIGITGSVGKTTTRGMVAACLMPKFQICQTQANNNNEIGLPQTILKALPSDQVIILEMGMRGRGEIELLSKIAAPDIAIITNIGLAHVERLGNQSEILKAKAEIIAGLKPEGLLILNADDENLMALASQIKNRLTEPKPIRLALISLNPKFAAPWPDVPVFHAVNLQITENHSYFELKTTVKQTAIPIVLPMPGRHLISNALFGFACAEALQLDLETAAKGAALFTQTGNRQNMLQAGSILLMDDTYNASPESMIAALETLKIAAKGRRLLAALGGMLELGDFAPQAHHGVGAAAAQAGYSWVAAIGPHAADLQTGFRSHRLSEKQDVQIFYDQTILIESLKRQLHPADALLVKGSRGFAMERVTAAVIEQFSPEKESQP